MRFWFKISLSNAKIETKNIGDNLFEQLHQNAVVSGIDQFMVVFGVV